MICRGFALGLRLKTEEKTCAEVPGSGILVFGTRGATGGIAADCESARILRRFSTLDAGFLTKKTPPEGGVGCIFSQCYI
jgi:hypothetical protein